MERQPVLFLCTHNSARSHIAEGLLRHLLAGDRVGVHSAGTEATHVRLLVIRATAEIGFDIAVPECQTFDRFLDHHIDAVITVCDLANEAYPVFLGALAIPPRADELREGTKRELAHSSSDACEGLRFAAHDRFISRLFLIRSLTSLAPGATRALLIVLAARHLHLPAAGFAWLIGAISVGALLNPLTPRAAACRAR